MKKQVYNRNFNQRTLKPLVSVRLLSLIQYRGRLKPWTRQTKKCSRWLLTPPRSKEPSWTSWPIPLGYRTLRVTFPSSRATGKTPRLTSNNSRLRWKPERCSNAPEIINLQVLRWTLPNQFKSSQIISLWVKSLPRPYKKPGSNSIISQPLRRCNPNTETWVPTM